MAIRVHIIIFIIAPCILKST